MVPLPLPCASTSNPYTFETKQSNTPLDDTKAGPADDDTSSIACIVCFYVKSTLDTRTIVACGELGSPSRLSNTWLQQCFVS